MDPKGFLPRWRDNFVTGLVIVLPGVVSIVILLWVFGTVANITDTLLFFLKYLLDPKWIYVNGVSGPLFWYWSLLALFLSVVLISFVGKLARNYFGQKMIEWTDAALMRIPLFNKIYAAIKQVNEAFSSGNKTSFKTVVLVEFPQAGTQSIGFVTGEPHAETQSNAGQNLVCVFVPTTPNPTSGFLLFVPPTKITRLNMSVADGIKYLVSLGSISPEPAPPADKRPNG